MGQGEINGEGGQRAWGMDEREVKGRVCDCLYLTYTETMMVRSNLHIVYFFMIYFSHPICLLFEYVRFRAQTTLRISCYDVRQSTFGVRNRIF